MVRIYPENSRLKGALLFSFLVVFLSITSVNAQPAQEWLYHKSVDGVEPDGNEQQLLWLMNNARTNPTAHGVFLTQTTDQGMLDFFQDNSVDVEAYKDFFATVNATYPVAFDRRLYSAALDAEQDYVTLGALPAQLALFQYFDDYGFFENGGYVFDTRRGVSSAGYAHAQQILVNSLHVNTYNNNYAENFTSVGIAYVNEVAGEFAPNTWVRAFSGADTTKDDHYNVFLVGTVWEDLDNDGMYDDGEGIEGVSVTPDKGTYYAVTGASGGYALPLTETGALSVTFSGTGLGDDVVKSATVTTQSVLLDASPADEDTGGGSSNGTTCIMPSLSSLLLD